MKRISWTVLAAAVAVVGCASRSGAPAPTAGGPEPIFRYISIAPFGSIRLGEPFAQRRVVADSVAPGVYRLRPRTFGGAEGIRVATDSAGLVRALYFTYAPGTFDAHVASYTSSLGPPRRVAGTDSTTREAWWADGATRFGLLEHNEPAEAETWAALLDGGR